jgi:hypothetical protein
VTNSEDNRIDLFGSTGTYVGTVKPTGTTFSRPQQTALGPDGSYWVADTLHNRVIHLNAAGAVLGTFTNGGAMKTPQGIAMDAEGNLYVSDAGNNAVEKYNQSGNLIATLATQGSGATNVSMPYAITVIGSPGHETLLIGDAGNNRILELGTNGAAVLSFGASGSGDGQLSSPRGAVLNPITGELAVSDFANNRISVWSSATAATSGKYVMSPSPMAASGSLAAGAGVTVNVTAENSGGTPIGGASIYLAFSPASGGGSASMGATALNSTPQAFTANGSGVVSVSYTAPGTLPNGGTDTLTAQNTSSSPTVSATDSYTFAPTSPPIASLSFSPVTIAAPGSLSAGNSVISVVTAKDSGGIGVAGAAVYLSFSGVGSAKVGGTALSGTPQSFTADASGQITITYTTPGVLPATGTDTITAGNAAVSPTVSKATAYSYGVPASYSLTPSPIAATGSLPASKSVTVRLRVLDSSSGSLAGATVYLSFTQATGGGTASVRGAALSPTPVAYITDSTGAIAITYTTPATPPSSGTDTISAANATSSATITASTSYTY